MHLVETCECENEQKKLIIKISHNKQKKHEIEVILLYFVQNCCAIFVAIAAANNKVVTALCLSSRWVFYIYFEIHFWCGKQKKKNP